MRGCWEITIPSNFYKIWSPLELIDSPNIGGLIGPLVTSNISSVWEENLALKTKTAAFKVQTNEHEQSVIVFSSVRSSNSHPDLLLTHHHQHPLFQITPVASPHYWTFTFWATTAISKAITGLICWLHVYLMLGGGPIWPKSIFQSFTLSFLWSYM